MITLPTCLFYQEYGDCGRRGECHEQASLALDQRPGKYRPIVVCGHHAEVITSRVPELGGIMRFIPIEQVFERWNWKSWLP